MSAPASSVGQASSIELLRQLGAVRVEPHRELRGHEFFPPAEELAKVPPLYGTEDTPTAAKRVMLHYFAAGSDWWVCELDPRTGTAFGYVCHADPANAEWGYFELNELCALLIPTMPPVLVERDLHWRPRPVYCCDLPGRRAS